MKDYICKESKVKGTKNKYYCFQVGKSSIHDTRAFFDFSIKWTTRSDHDGPRLYLEFFGFYLLAQIYDNRHWCDLCKKHQDQECRDNRHDDY